MTSWGKLAWQSDGRTDTDANKGFHEGVIACGSLKHSYFCHLCNKSGITLVHLFVAQIYRVAERREGSCKLDVSSINFLPVHNSKTPKYVGTYNLSLFATCITGLYF